VSGLGRGDAAQVGRETVEVVREVTRDLERLGRAARDASGGTFGSLLGVSGGGGAAGAVASGASAGGGGSSAVGGMGAIAASAGLGLASIAGGAASAASGLLLDNFVTNAAARSAKSFAIDTTSGVLGDAVKFGFGSASGLSFGESVTASAIRAGSSLPIVGDLFAQVDDPVSSARARVTAIATTVARAGGKLGDDELRGLKNAFLPEEQRAKQAELDVEKFFKAEGIAGSAIEGTPLGELLGKLQEVAPQFVDAMKAFADAVNGWVGGGHR